MSIHRQVRFVQGADGRFTIEPDDNSGPIRSGQFVSAIDCEGVEREIGQVTRARPGEPMGILFAAAWNDFIFSATEDALCEPRRLRAHAAEFSRPLRSGR